jgi:hypothetical protein
LAAVLGSLPRRYIEYAYAGGVMLPGAHHNGYTLLVIPRDDHEAYGSPENAGRKMQEILSPGITQKFSLGEFCIAPCVITGEMDVSRLELVCYLANKLGGVHLEPVVQCGQIR